VATTKEELKTWKIATFVMVSLAVVAFLIQRFLGPFFDVVFEICIFYVPALTIVGLLLYFRAHSN